MVSLLAFIHFCSLLSSVSWLVTPGQSQLEARYSAVKGFGLMSIGLAVCKFNR